MQNPNSNNWLDILKAEKSISDRFINVLERCLARQLDDNMTIILENSVLLSAGAINCTIEGSVCRVSGDLVYPDGTSDLIEFGWSFSGTSPFSNFNEANEAYWIRTPQSIPSNEAVILGLIVAGKKIEFRFAASTWPECTVALGFKKCFQSFENNLIQQTVKTINQINFELSIPFAIDKSYLWANEKKTRLNIYMDFKDEAINPVSFSEKFLAYFKYKSLKSIAITDVVNMRGGPRP